MGLFQYASSTPNPDEVLFHQICFEILDFTEDSTVYRALKQAQIDTVIDLISLQEEDFDRLRFDPSPQVGQQVRAQELPLGHRRKLLLFIRWIRNLIQEQPSSCSMDPKAWAEITKADFDDYRISGDFEDTPTPIPDRSMTQDFDWYEQSYMYDESYVDDNDEKIIIIKILYKQRHRYKSLFL